jgi:multiple sugar transport system substrate-binding protein
VLYANPLYRKDLFRDDFLKREFEERYKIPLEPPKSWAHYLSIAEFFSRLGNRHSPTEYGNALDIAYTEEIMGAFYPPVVGIQGQAFRAPGVSRLNSIEARNALKNLVECSRFAHPDLFRDRPVGTVKKC